MRTFRKRGDEPLQALRKFAHDGVRERHRTLEARGTYELDGVVADRVVGLVGECELVGTEPKGGANRPIELAHRPLAELLDPGFP